MLEHLVPLVKAAAREELLPRFTGIGFNIKEDDSLVTEADLAVDARLRSALHTLSPQVRFLSEEMPRAEQEALLAAGGEVWSLDPLDGTSNFVAGVPYFSISLALVRDGAPVLGIVYDPSRDECFTAERGRGASLNGVPLKASHLPAALDRTVAIVDFKRLDASLRRRLVDSPPFASQRNFGSSALDWAWLAAGRCHLYLHGGQKVWDYSAGSLILAEAGGQSCTLQGEPVFVSAVTPRSVVASLNQQLFDDWAAWLGVKPESNPTH